MVINRRQSIRQIPDWNVGPNYQLVRQIGQGAYSQVCEAIHIPTGQRVAIKHMVSIFDDIRDCKRLLREISLLRMINHPNIVKIREILLPQSLMDFNELFVVLEYMQTDLKKLFKSPIFLDGDRIQLIAYNIVCAINYLHSAQIIHRDIKPGNILLNDDCSIKLCDFGLARSLFEPDREQENALQDYELAQLSPDLFTPQRIARNRRLSTHVVTRWYRAPELILMNQDYAYGVDV